MEGPHHDIKTNILYIYVDFYISMFTLLPGPTVASKVHEHILPVKCKIWSGLESIYQSYYMLSQTC